MKTLFRLSRWPVVVAISRRASADDCVNVNPDAANADTNADTDASIDTDDC